MKERPILFNGPMVRAILDGRKTQTRRVIKKGIEFVVDDEDRELIEVLRVDGEFPPHWCSYNSDYPDEGSMPPFQCPFGQPGDRLWVRETFGTTKGNGIQIIYRADYTEDDSGERVGGWIGPRENERFIHGKIRWAPCIHMPRWASRITLEITNVRVERLQEISEADAQAEGVLPATNGHDECGPTKSHHCGFVRLWRELCPDESEASWFKNPWVWVIEFKRVTP